MEKKTTRDTQLGYEKKTIKNAWLLSLENLKSN